MHEIKTEDIYEDFNSNKELFDFGIIPLTQNIIMNRRNESLKK